jgi:drug/metabolite transporter (DMT)-like permease
MSKTIKAMLIVALLATLTALADLFFKLASERTQPLHSRHFWVGVILYSIVGVGTVYVFQYLKLAVFGITYAVTDVLLLALIGTWVFREQLSRSEWMGIGLGLISLILLSRSK